MFILTTQHKKQKTVQFFIFSNKVIYLSENQVNWASLNLPPTDIMLLKIRLFRTFFFIATWVSLLMYFFKFFDGVVRIDLS